ncbi:MAG: toprim domain-containing protein [Streptosporangiaceae bacterium]
MTAGRASPDQPPQVSSLGSGADWAAWLRQAAPVHAPAMRRPDGQDLARGWNALVHLARRQGFTVHRADTLARDGFTTWPGRRIRVPANAAPAEAVTALAHQLAHVLLHGRIARLDPSGSVPCQGIRKVEADSVAYLVTTHLGIGAPTITFPQVSSWAGTDQRAQPGRTIQTVSSRVVAAAALVNRYLDAELGIGQAAPAPVLADGAEISPSSPLAADRRDLVRVHQAAAQFFRTQLPGSWVPGYLSARGFGTSVQQRWQIGYAPAGWDTLTRHLRGAGYPDQLIEAAGLTHRSRRGTLIDTFRDRAVLPIHAADGTLVAFIGRASNNAGAGVPKYLNSPHTALYDKGRVLFGLWEARDALGKGARPVIVEGPFDAIAVTTAGRGRYAGLAPCGTALTSGHLACLDNAANLTTTDVLVAFDADQAGRRAAVRAYHLLTPFSGDLTAVSFPAGQDPAQILQSRGPDGLARVLRRTQPLADLVIDAEVARWERWLQYAEGQIRALRAAASLIAAMPPGDVARQVVRLAERFGLRYSVVTEAVTDALPDVIATGRIASTGGGGASRRQPTDMQPLAVRAASQDFPGSAQQATGRAVPGRSPRAGASRAAEPRLRGGHVAG